MRKPGRGTSRMHRAVGTEYPNGPSTHSKRLEGTGQRTPPIVGYLDPFGNMKFGVAAAEHLDCQRHVPRGIAPARARI